jgi:hypothetical protein
MKNVVRTRIKNELGQLSEENWLKSSLYMYKTDRNYELWYETGKHRNEIMAIMAQVEVASH